MVKLWCLPGDFDGTHYLLILNVTNEEETQQQVIRFDAGTEISVESMPWQRLSMLTKLV